MPTKIETKTFEYRVTFVELDESKGFERNVHEIVRVEAMNINGGYSRVMHALFFETREIVKIELWQVV